MLVRDLADKDHLQRGEHETEAGIKEDQGGLRSFLHGNSGEMKKK